MNLDARKKKRYSATSKAKQTTAIPQTPSPITLINQLAATATPPIMAQKNKRNRTIQTCCLVIATNLCSTVTVRALRLVLFMRSRECERRLAK